MRRKMKGGDEHDAFTDWRHVLFWKPGERKRIKRKANRRERREMREKLKNPGGSAWGPWR